MSDTPRTDAFVTSDIEDSDAYLSQDRMDMWIERHADLERELAEWHRIAGEKIAALERERDALVALRDDPYVIDCYIVPHEGENMETMFRGNSPHLKDYAIVPRKQFDELRAEVERLRALLSDAKRGIVRI